MMDPFSFLTVAKDVLPQRLFRWAGAIAKASEATGECPLLLSAICDRESGGGLYLSTKGPDGVGDGGNGLGLFQVDRRYHRAWAEQVKADGTPLWQDPEENALKGASILADNRKRVAMLLPGRQPEVKEAATVALYNAGWQRLMEALKACPRTRPLREQLAAVDSVTTPGPTKRPDYASDVLARRLRYLTVKPRRSA